MIEIDVLVSGPVFDGRAQAAIARAGEQAEDVVAQAGVDEVRRLVRTYAKKRSGTYEGRVTSDRAAGDRVVHDQDTVYGPWLEGLMWRNIHTGYTGFQPYATATRILKHKTPALVGPIFDRAIRSL